MCNNCEKHAINAVKNLYKKAKVTASHLEKCVTIEIKGEIDINAVKTAFENFGYSVKDYSVTKTKSKGLFGFLAK